MRVLYGVSFPGTALAFLKGQLSYLREAGHSVGVVAPDTVEGDVAAMCERERVSLFNVPMKRQPDVRSDIRSAFMILRSTKRFSPDAVIAGTPKASFLLLGASLVLGVNHRIYLCHGLRFEGFEGWKRLAAQFLETVLCSLSTDTVAVSQSVKRGLVEIGVPAARISVLGFGSPNGVDTDRFQPAGVVEKQKIREGLGLTNPAGELLFVGRLTHDKGVRYLYELAVEMPTVSLTVIGPVEISSESDAADMGLLRQLPNVRLTGEVGNIEDFMKAADLLLLPSKREGLPTVIIEAAACGLPVVTMEATGTVDAVSACESGIVVPQGNIRQFVEAVAVLLGDEERRSLIGSRSRLLAGSRFGHAVVWRQWKEYLDAL